jgi:hypothetical protein
VIGEEETMNKRSITMMFTLLIPLYGLLGLGAWSLHQAYQDASWLGLALASLIVLAGSRWIQRWHQIYRQDIQRRCGSAHAYPARATGDQRRPAVFPRSQQEG